LMQAYGRADDELRLHQAKVCSVLSLVLVPACIGLDYFAYPELLGRMFVARLICDVVLLPCFLLLFTPWGRRHVHLLGNAPPLIPGITICWMIYASEGVFSPYYAGLNIVLVGVILLIPYTLTEAGIICAVVVSCYARVSAPFSTTSISSE
jgi:two-component system sensor histidine kinase PhcS